MVYHLNCRHVCSCELGVLPDGRRVKSTTNHLFRHRLGSTFSRQPSLPISPDITFPDYFSYSCIVNVAVISSPQGPGFYKLGMDNGGHPLYRLDAQLLGPTQKPRR